MVPPVLVVVQRRGVRAGPDNAREAKSLRPPAPEPVLDQPLDLVFGHARLDDAHGVDQRLRREVDRRPHAADFILVLDEPELRYDGVDVDRRQHEFITLTAEDEVGEVRVVPRPLAPVDEERAAPTRPRALLEQVPDLGFGAVGASHVGNAGERRGFRPRPKGRAGPAFRLRVARRQVERHPRRLPRVGCDQQPRVLRLHARQVEEIIPLAIVGVLGIVALDVPLLRRAEHGDAADHGPRQPVAARAEPFNRNRSCR